MIVHEGTGSNPPLIRGPRPIPPNWPSGLVLLGMSREFIEAQGTAAPGPPGQGRPSFQGCLVRQPGSPGSASGEPPKSDSVSAVVAIASTAQRRWAPALAATSAAYVTTQARCTRSASAAICCSVLKAAGSRYAGSAATG